MFTWRGEAANVTRPVRFTGEGTGRERLSTKGRERLSALPEALSPWRAVSTGLAALLTFACFIPKQLCEAQIFSLFFLGDLKHIQFCVCVWGGISKKKGTDLTFANCTKHTSK